MRILKNIQKVISQILKKESDYDNIKKSYANVFQMTGENERKSGFEEIILKVDNILNLQKDKNSNFYQKIIKWKALSLFQLKRNEEALPIFELLAEKQGTPKAWLNVMSSAILSGKIDVGERAFEKAKHPLSQGSVDDPVDEKQPSGAELNYYYICTLCAVKEYKKCLDPLNVLKDLYSTLVITDSTFLYIRRIPFIEDTLQKAVEVFKHEQMKEYGLKWLEELASNVDEDGNSTIQTFIDNLSMAR